MRSPVRSVRAGAELLLRLSALGVLGWALVLALQPRSESPVVERIGAGELGPQLRSWVRDGPPDAVHLSSDSLPDDSLLAWLVSLRRTGTAVSWSGDLEPLAVAVEPVNAPAGGARILLAAPADSRVAIRDAAGPLDTLVAGRAGAALRVPVVAGGAAARLGPTIARAPAADSLVPGAVLLLATAGWEARYVTAALEESGWRVDARLDVAPGITVRRGRPGAPDTARYAAVVALDSAAGGGDARRIAAFARAGGGVVVSGVAAGLPALRDLSPGVPGDRVRPAAAAFTADAPRQALSFVAIGRLKPDAVVLERRNDVPVVAARRAGTGRILQIGYDETWRWRMQGGPAGLDAHRRWWSDALAATALRRDGFAPSPGDSRAAPRAAAVRALGPPSPAPAAQRASATARSLHPWMLVLALVLLLAEWSSRRLRGVA